MHSRLWLAVLFVGGCSSFAGTDPSTGEGADGGEVLRSADASVDVGADPPPVGAPDAGGSDATTAPPPFCDPKDGRIKFCTHFEDPATAPTYGWTYVDTAGGAGSLAVEDGVGRDKSRGLHVKLTNAKGTTSLSAWLIQEVHQASPPTSFDHYELDFAFYEPIAVSLGYAVLGGVTFPQQSGYDMAAFGVAHYDGPYLDTETPEGAGGLTEQTGHWYAAVVKLDRDPNGMYHRRTTVDGTVVDDSPDHDLGPAKDTNVRLGAYFTSVSKGTVEVVFDDVRLLQY